MPKGKWAHELISKIIKNDDKILYSDVNICELKIVGYSSYDINNILQPIKSILIFVESSEKQIGKAKDLSLKRDIPKRDALHALIARDNKAILVTLDRHFQKISDIVKPRRPQYLI